MPIREGLSATLAGLALAAAVQALERLGLNARPQPPGGASAVEVLVMVGITGDASGSLMLALGQPEAMRLVGHLMGEGPPDAWDELVASGLAEVGNILAGHVATELNQAGLMADIGVPSVVRGAQLDVQLPQRPWHRAELLTEVGPLALGVGLAHELELA